MLRLYSLAVIQQRLLKLVQGGYGVLLDAFLAHGDGRGAHGHTVALLRVRLLHQRAVYERRLLEQTLISRN